MIRDVHHVGIVVAGMERAFALFRDTLGLPVVKEGDVPSRRVRAAMLRVGGSYLELLEPVDGESPFAKHIEQQGEGLHHLALLSDGIEADVQRLRDLSVPLLDHEPRPGFTGRLSYLAPSAFDGAQLEMVQPPPGSETETAAGVVTRIDHVVLRAPDPQDLCDRFDEYFGVPTKRRFDRGGMLFAFMRPGNVIIEVIGPKAGGEPGTGRIAGLALEVTDIDGMTAALKARGYPAGEPHPALQGGRIMSVHHSGACGVPLALIARD